MIFKVGRRTFLVGKWIRLHDPKAGSWGSVPGQGTRSYILQLRVHMPQLKTLHAATKTQHSQMNIYWKEKCLASTIHQCGPVLRALGFGLVLCSHCLDILKFEHEAPFSLCTETHKLCSWLWVSSCMPHVRGMIYDWHLNCVLSCGTLYG